MEMVRDTWEISMSRIPVSVHGRGDKEEKKGSGRIWTVMRGMGMRKVEDKWGERYGETRCVLVCVPAANRPM
jgi:hypothetical protein